MHRTSVVLVAFALATAACSAAEDPTSKDDSAAIAAQGKETPDGSIVPPNPGSDGGPIVHDGGTAAPPDDYARLVGAWHSKDHPFYAAVFYAEAAKPLGHAFFADLDGPSLTSAASLVPNRATGSYRLPYPDMTLEVSTNRDPYNGVTSFAMIDDDTFKVVVPGSRGEEEVFSRIESYCDLVSDCDGQSFKHVDCVGRATCSAHACGWECGYGDPSSK